MSSPSRSAPRAAPAPPKPAPVPPPAVRPPGETEDPVRATLMQVLRTLNAAETEYEREEEKGKELIELQYEMQSFWAVAAGHVKVQVILGVLLKNKMIQHVATPTYSWTRQRNIGDRYRIAGPGKAFLLENIKEKGRIS